MTTQVVGAAKAFFPLKGMSAEEAWEFFTDMFDSSGRSFVPFRSMLEVVRRRYPHVISVGDVFKYSLSRGTPIHLIIVESTPHISFAYDEQHLPLRGKDLDKIYNSDLRTRTNYFFRRHPEGMLVEINRREKFAISLKQHIMQEHAAEAARRLAFALSRNGYYPESHFQEDGEALEIEDCTVQRDDSLRLDF